VDWLSVGVTFSKNSHRDFLEALPAKTGIKLLQAQLRVHAYEPPQAS